MADMQKRKKSYIFQAKVQVRLPAEGVETLVCLWSSWILLNAASKKERGLVEEVGLDVSEASRLMKLQVYILVQNPQRFCAILLEEESDCWPWYS